MVGVVGEHRSAEQQQDQSQSLHRRTPSFGYRPAIPDAFCLLKFSAYDETTDSIWCRKGSIALLRRCRQRERSDHDDWHNLIYAHFLFLDFRRGPIEARPCRDLGNGIYVGRGMLRAIQAPRVTTRFHHGGKNALPVFGLRGLIRLTLLEIIFRHSSFFLCPIAGRCASQHRNASLVHAPVYKSEIGGFPVCPEIRLSAQSEVSMQNLSPVDVPKSGRYCLQKVPKGAAA